MFTQEIIDATIEGLNSNKRDLAFHMLNRERFISIVSDPETKEGEFKSKLEAEIKVLNDRIDEVNLIIKHTELQLEAMQK